MHGDRQDGNVVALPGRGNARAPGQEIASAAVGYLDELDRCLLHISPHFTWSPRRWTIASTPFRMRLVGARTRLAELPALYSILNQDDDRWWFLELQDALSDAEQRIRELDKCLRTLQHGDTAASVRASETEIFATRKQRLMSTASRIRSLLSQQFPELVAHDRR